MGKKYDWKQRRLLRHVACGERDAKLMLARQPTRFQAPNRVNKIIAEKTRHIS